ncbi:hypothetical protein FKW77_008747 [Venturia effusa]|uniref:ABM domain-containing protein n=1 Tax=Venturia effusa TaxID=50376 RepID=A0A517KX28_9PEZI|nr:hypothetical protein FKW77_008747 [Venturia effusa]
MPTLVTTAHLQTKSKEARDKLISIFKEITEYSLANEKDGVLRYITAVPIDSTDDASIYMIEEYADRAASDAHFKTPPVQKLVSEFEASEPLIEAPEIIDLAPSVEFKRPISSTPGVISLAHINFKPGKAVAAIEGFKTLIESLEKHEESVLAYAALLDEEKDSIRTIEMYESAEYYDRVHKGSSSNFAKAIEENPNRTKADRSGEMEVVKLKVIQGFFERY